MDQLKLHRPRRRDLTALLLLAVLIGLCLGSVLATGWYTTRPALELAENETYGRSTTIVGISKDGGQAKLATLTVELMLGKGRLLISVPPYENEDTQMSARNAKLAAERETGYDLSQVDIILSIEADAEVVTGPSAGTAMAVVLVAAIESRWVRQDVVVSATIGEYGRLGPVGDIKKKIDAAKEAGFSLFVVSIGQTGVPGFPGIEVERARNLHEAVDLMLW